jgi:trimeric autotransporter adhesin
MPRPRTIFLTIFSLITCLFLATSAFAAESGPSSFSRLPAGAQAAISAAIGRDVAAYHVRASADGFHADNIRHDLSLEFGPGGVMIRNGQALFQMQARGYGYEESLKTFEPVAPQAVDNRVEYRRGPFTEWYVNGPMGLEQGFTIAQAPGHSNGQPLTIALSFAGNLIANVDQSRAALTLSGKTELKYAGLTATDVAGKKLSAWLELRGEQLLLRVDDTRANYPVTIDPWVQSAKLTASDGQEGDLLGSSVAIDGDTLVVGISTYSRDAAYVFVKPASGWGNMTQTAILTPSDSTSGADFGVSVSISGDTIAVAAPRAQGIYRGTEGAVYVFVKPTSGWKSMSQTAKLTVSRTGIGSPVAISNQTIAVPGASGVFLFVKPKTGWVNKGKPTSTLLPDQFGRSFGYSLAIAANTVAVGAPGAFYQGAVYLFMKPGGAWPKTMNPTARLVGSDGFGDSIGTSVATNGNYVFAGAPSSNQSRGGIYVYVKPAGGWSNMVENAVLSAADTVYLGYSVSASGNTVVAGAPSATVGANPLQGAAFIFVKPAAGWKTTSKANAMLVADDGMANDGFGASVGISGNTVVSGAPQAAIGSNLYQGAAYVFGR